METKNIALPDIVSREEWLAEHEKFLAREKQFTKQYDKLNADRRRLPMEPFSNDYVFEGPGGKISLLDMFNGRKQLLLYNFMFEPGAVPCVGCSMFVDNLPNLAHLHARDTSLALTSPARLTEIKAYKKRMGWTVPWYSSFVTDFNTYSGVGTGHRITAFIHDGENVYRTYYTNNRGTELLGTIWALLDITPLGRQETWEDSPEGWPQTPPFTWWRKHDEYEK